MNAPGPRSAFLALLPGIVLETACAPDVRESRGANETAIPAHPPVGPAVFTDVTDQVDLRFVHDTRHIDPYFFPEIMGGGAGVFDYDNDGDLDIYLVHAGPDQPTTPESPASPNRLLRRESDGSYTDVTAASGLGDTGYGMGCAIGDIDNDGDRDVFVSNYGPDALYLNNGDGTFTDITASAGIIGDRWSCSAGFLDYDGDGLLDLYVTSYVDYVPTRVCTDAVGRPDYCGPEGFAGLPDVLYHNDGGRRFTDVSTRAGIAATQYAGLGLYCSDFDGDGRIDIYVANDADPDNLWVNQGNGTFVDEGVKRGAAYNEKGQTEAGMGVAAGDADGDFQQAVPLSDRAAQLASASGQHELAGRIRSRSDLCRGHRPYHQFALVAPP